jgi:hydroxymethylbilane synthase
MIKPVLQIGTRGSPLALAQTKLACNRIAAAGQQASWFETIDVRAIRTSGDRFLDRPLIELGGKGLFTREIDDAMLAREIDLAVHSVKDLPTTLPPLIVLGAVLSRGDPRDAAILRSGRDIGDLPHGAVVGTASLRRQAQLLSRRPDLKVVPLRGNIKTRLQKVTREGSMDATILALSGLDRLGIADVASSVLEPVEMLPAVGQGAIGITCRIDDTRCRELLACVNDAVSAVAIEAERAMLATLDGSCRTPIAGLATLSEDTVRLIGLVLSPDGSKRQRVERAAHRSDASRLGHDIGSELLRAIDWTWRVCES